MLKKTEEPIKEIRVEGIEDFLTRFNLKTQFKKEYGCSINEWDYEVDDQTCIEGFLEKLAGIWSCKFEENRNAGYFIISEWTSPSATQRVIEQIGDMVIQANNDPEKLIKTIHGQMTNALLTLKGE
jgi:hypothetical protein